MTKLTPIRLKDYETKDPAWWCEHHKNTIAYLIHRLGEYKSAESEQEKAKIMALIDIVVRNTKEEDNE